MPRFSALGALLAFGSFVPFPTEAVLVTGFANDLPGSFQDDAIELFNEGPTSLRLEDVVVSDGEGSISFPPGEWLPGVRIVAAGNGTAFLDAAGRGADYALNADEASARIREVDSGFLLAQTGDELLLYHQGRLRDVVRYGTSTTESDEWSGEPVYVGGGPFLRWFARSGTETGFLDSDSKEDWESPKRSILGRTSHASRALWHDAEARAFTAPENSRQTFLDVLSQTERRLWINVYEFLDADLARRIAARPELEIRVLLDEQPVGLDARERAIRDSIVELLESSGATVHYLGHDRYAFDHAKYVLSDDRFVLIQSENFVGSGMPTDPARGNRGWGILFDSPELATELVQVFEADFALNAYGARVPDRPASEPLPLPVVPTQILGPPPRGTVRDRGFQFQLFVAPDETLGPGDLILEAIRSAQSEILVEQLNLPPKWTGRTGAWPNAYLEALVDAAERGVDVRILLDGHFVDPDDAAPDNLDTLEYVATLDAALPINVRVMDDREAPLLHVKGLVVDRRGVLVGSMNWNLNSVVENREVTVWVESPMMAGFFSQAFEDDWALAGEPASETTVPSLGVPDLAIVIILGLFGSRMRGRRGTQT